MAKKKSGEIQETNEQVKPAVKEVRETITKKLHYSFDRPYTQEQLTEKSHLLAEACADKVSLEDEKKSVVSEFKSRIDSKTSTINLLSGQINRGKERVGETCDCVFDFDKGTKTFFFEGKQVGVERMLPTDYQLEIQQPAADVDDAVFGIGTDGGLEQKGDYIVRDGEPFEEAGE